MADIELVIKIPDNYDLSKIENGSTASKIILNAVAHGVPLPKVHGRLIDADALEKRMCDREEELRDDRAVWESSAVSVALDMFAPTIIEADKAESEEK